MGTSDHPSLVETLKAASPTADWQAINTGDWQFRFIDANGDSLAGDAQGNRPPGTAVEEITHAPTDRFIRATYEGEQLTTKIAVAPTRHDDAVELNLSITTPELLAEHSWADLHRVTVHGDGTITHQRRPDLMNFDWSAPELIGTTDLHPYDAARHILFPQQGDAE